MTASSSRRLVPVTLVLLAALPVGACTVILPGPPVPTPAPTPANPCLADGRPEVHLWVGVRIDRTTVNLAETYGTFVRGIPAALLQIGARPTRVVLFALDEQRGRAQPLAAAGCDIGGQELDPTFVIEQYAREAPPRVAGEACAVTPLLEAGADLSNLVTEYPASIPGESGRRVFGLEPPAAVVVMYLDSMARSAGRTDPACEGAARMAAVDGEVADWLGYSPGVPMSRVYHWMIATDEGVRPEDFEASCRLVEGAPLAALDVLEPSARSLYDPLASEIESAGGRAARGNMCALLGSAGQRSFFGERLLELAGDLDLDPSGLESFDLSDLALPDDVEGR